MGHGGTKAGGEGCELTLPPPGTSAGGGSGEGTGKQEVATCLAVAVVHWLCAGQGTCKAKGANHLTQKTGQHYQHTLRG